MRPDPYHDDLTADSHSSLELLRDDPAEYAAQRVLRAKSRPAPTRDMVVGSALHTLVLETEEMPKRYQVVPTLAKKHVARIAAGREPLTAKEAGLIQDMVKALGSSPVFLRVANAPGVCERPIYWTDPDTGIRCKCKPDKLLPGVGAVDLKSIASVPRSRDEAERRLTRTIYEYGYHRAAAFTLSGLQYGEQVEGGPIEGGRYVFIFVAKEPPHRVVPVELDDELLLLGHRQNQETLAELKRRRETNDWAEEAIDEVLTLSAERWMT